MNLFAKTGNISLYSSGLNVTSAGNGASVTLEAESGDTTVYGDLSVSGGGSNGSGGLISMIAGNSTQFAGTNWLSASGAGTGNGGTLKIQNQTGFDTGKLGVTFIATGGAPGSSAGNGGTLQVETSGNIVFDPATTNVSALGNNGNGGTISLSSNGNLLVTSPVSLDGNGSGSGGTINFQASANALVQGDLSASSAGGKGGSITVSSQFAGAPFKVDSSATVGIQGKVSATGATAGGSIALKSLFSGLQLLRWTDLDVSGGTDGGTIRLNNSFGNLTVPTGVVSVSGTGASGKGGNIEIHSFSNLILTGAGVLQLEANGSGTGDGGSIKVGGLQSVTKLGNGTGEFILSATGGSIGSTSGNGGSIDVSGNPVSLVSAFYDVSPRGLNGNGGTVKLTGSSINSDAPINVDGKGIGDGGYAYVQSNTNFSVGPGITTSGVSSISARAGAAGGSGGKIELRGSITVNSPSDLRIDATDGHGGFLLLQGLALTVLNAGTFNANGAGTGAVDHSGGTVYIYAQNSLTMSGVSISANAGINGYGGGVSVYSTNSTFSIGGPGANLSLIEALGGTTSGDGGNIGLGFANLTADGGSLRTGLCRRTALAAP